jgi:hypothetical protein
MSDLLPLLKPLRGNFGNRSSLVDYKICRDKEGKVTLRFSIAIGNVGSGDLYVMLGDPQQIDGKTRVPAKQIITKDDGGRREVDDIGFYDRHEEKEPDGHTHVHWHYNGLAKLELVNKKDGKIVSKSDKEGYCLADTIPIPNFPVARPRQFHASGCERRGELRVGLTLGWLDHYKFSTDKQYIPIQDVPPGEYQIKFTVNKTKMIYEIEEPAVIDISITEGDKRTAVKCADL